MYWHSYTYIWYIYIYVQSMYLHIWLSLYTYVIMYAQIHYLYLCVIYIYTVCMYIYNYIYMHMHQNQRPTKVPIACHRSHTSHFVYSWPEICCKYGVSLGKSSTGGLASHVFFPKVHICLHKFLFELQWLLLWIRCLKVTKHQ